MNKDLWQDKKLAAKHFTSTKACGGLKDVKKRKRFCLKNNIEYSSLTTAQQVHGKRIKVVNKKDIGKEIPETDGLITGIPGAMLAIFTADCMPVFMLDKAKTAVGVIHAGWRGLHKGIVLDAVTLFKKRFNVRAQDLEIVIGPHIQKCCYSIGEEVIKAFKLKRSQKALSLARIAVRQLREAGVKNIHVSGCCTFHEKNKFFSYRRNKTDNRMMSCITLGVNPNEC